MSSAESKAVPRPNLWQRIKEEPAVIISLISSGLAVGMAFGLELTAEQREAILALALAIFGGGVAIRQQVTPDTKSKRVEEEAATQVRR